MCCLVVLDEIVEESQKKETNGGKLTVEISVKQVDEQTESNR